MAAALGRSRPPSDHDRVDLVRIGQFQPQPAGRPLDPLGSRQLGDLKLKAPVGIHQVRVLAKERLLHSYGWLNDETLRERVRAVMRLYLDLG